MSTRGAANTPRGVSRGRIGRGGVKRGAARGGAGRGGIGRGGASEDSTRGAARGGRGAGRGRGASKGAANKIGGNQQNPKTKEVHPNGQRLIKITDIPRVYKTSVDIPTIPSFQRIGLKDASPITLITPGQLNAAKRLQLDDLRKSEAVAGPSKPAALADPPEPSEPSDPSDSSDDSDDPDHWNSNYGPDGPYWGGDYSDDDLRGLVDEIGSGFGCTAPGMAYKHWDD
ncbi:hypothetical protein K523DRAFT_353694 [Schizophyllum commune Tattone D]|nr:hypothetical protein K523DRAFT_353694 [Schizophyllum commune Tattone D]